MIRHSSAASATLAAGLGLGLAMAASPAQALYLNYLNMTVALGPSMAPEPSLCSDARMPWMHSIDPLRW